jgi:NitT/TauT family transport system substrate-binding protein
MKTLLLMPTQPDQSALAGSSRRKLLQGAAAAAGLAALAAPARVRAQASPKIRIGFWPVAAGLPFFAALD